MEKKNMNLTNFIQKLFGKKDTDIKAPFVIINKDQDIIEYDSIEDAIAEPEKTRTSHYLKSK
jgi:hypothetical protein